MITPIRDITLEKHQYKKDDVLVIFGEVFQRGYVNGIIEEAQRIGMKVIYSTVGRRNREGQLVPLSEEELQSKKQSPLINIPLEAGFDFEPSSQGTTPVDQLKGYKLSQWENVEIDWNQIEESRLKGVERFREKTQDFLKELEPHLKENSQVLFAHTMAGGFPRAKIVMPVANKVFKGFDQRFMSSETFWDSSLGKLCQISFNEVTAETFRHLIELTESMRSQRKVSYVAFGYHGTESFIEGDYRWQSYSPYLQGWAKLQLENIAKENFEKDINSTVFNCPEILTNSTSIFLGVEVCLYPLIGALQKEAANNKKVNDLLEVCESKLKPEFKLKDLLEITNDYMNDSLIRESSSLEGWPQHNGPDQMKKMRLTSLELIGMHKDENDLMTVPLSEVIFQACGQLMMNHSWNHNNPVYWIGQDAVAKQANLWME